MPKMMPTPLEKSTRTIVKEVHDEILCLMAETRTTQVELAKVLNITPTTMSRKMHNPGTFTLAEIAKAKAMMGG